MMKFADILPLGPRAVKQEKLAGHVCRRQKNNKCEHATVPEDGLESSPWPLISTPTRSQAVMSPDLRPCSRSSPVRSNVEEEWLRAHSPSISPKEARKHATEAQTFDRSLPHNPKNSSCSHSFHYTPCNGNGVGEPGMIRVTAFYSMRPPVMPMKLVPVTPATPPAFQTHSSTSSPPLPSFAAAQMEDERCKNAMHSVICELVAGLPLTTSSSPPPRMRNAGPACPAPPAPTLVSNSTAPISQTMINASNNSRCRSPPAGAAVWIAASTGSVGSAVSAARVRRIHDHCNVSTQAHVSGRVRSDDGFEERSDSGADEWLGGVRALRDSHVRLVLRQLRHIERLNRALDRAARPVPAHAACTHPVQVSHAANVPSSYHIHTAVPECVPAPALSNDHTLSTLP